ncbi:MAG: serine hydrolase domain-containing protein [Parvibaculum sp.]
MPYSNVSAPPSLSDFTDLVHHFHVPGASLAVLHGDQIYELAAGVTNLNTRVEATSDTLFQIGSITKLYTSCLILQLVDEGKLSLDDRGRKHLPDFRLADEGLAAQVTIRHLLTHTSGIDGDFFVDAGRGEDRVEKFVGMLGSLPSLHPLGTHFAYCNVGYVLLGRILEVVGGDRWDKAIRNRIAKPLGTPGFSTLPEQAMRFRTAIGHLRNSEDGLVATPLVYLAQSNAPAGSMSMASARDVVLFGDMLLHDGRAPNGTRLLSEASARAMREVQKKCPPGSPLDAMGLGAFLWHWGPKGGGEVYNVFGHDGSTIGQSAFLRIHPESGTIFVLLTNGGDGKGLAHELMTRVFSEAAGVCPHEVPQIVESAGDLTRLAGVYGKSSETAEVRVIDSKLYATIRPIAAYNVIGGGQQTELLPVGPDRFIGYSKGMTQPVNFNFLDMGADGRPATLYTGVRLFTRTGGGT